MRVASSADFHVRDTTGIDGAQLGTFGYSRCMFLGTGGSSMTRPLISQGAEGTPRRMR